MENFSLYLILSLIGPVFVLVIYIMIKTIKTGRMPDSRFTPFDVITGQTTVEFHEEKEEREEEDEQGDDKFKNRLR